MKMVATVQLEIDVPDNEPNKAAYAADTISEALTNNLMYGKAISNWTYLKLGHAYLYAVEGKIDENS